MRTPFFCGCMQYYALKNRTWKGHRKALVNCEPMLHSWRNNKRQENYCSLCARVALCSRGVCRHTSLLCTWKRGTCTFYSRALPNEINEFDEWHSIREKCLWSFPTFSTDQQVRRPCLALSYRSITCIDACRYSWQIQTSDPNAKKKFVALCADPNMADYDMTLYMNFRHFQTRYANFILSNNIFAKKNSPTVDVDRAQLDRILRVKHELVSI